MRVSKRYSGEFKVKVCKYMIENNVSAYKAERHFGITGRGTAAYWFNAYLKHGESALLDGHQWQDYEKEEIDMLLHTDDPVRYLCTIETSDGSIRVFGSYWCPFFDPQEIALYMNYKKSLRRVMKQLDEQCTYTGTVYFETCVSNHTLLNKKGLRMFLNIIDPESAYRVFRNIIKSFESHSRSDAVTDPVNPVDTVEANTETIEPDVVNETMPESISERKYTVSEMLNNPDVLTCVLDELKSLKEAMAEMQPKADYYDSVLSAKDAISVTTIAKEFGKSANWLNTKLRDMGIQYKQNGTWVLSAKYADCGFTVIRTTYTKYSDGETHAYNTTYWTQAGRKFIHELLDSRM